MKVYSAEFVYNLKIYIPKNRNMVGILFNFQNSLNFDQIIFLNSNSGKKSEILFQKIINNKETERLKKQICEKSNNIINECVSINYDQWNELLILNYEDSLSIHLNDEIIFNLKSTTDKMKNSNTFGLNYFFSNNQIGFKDIEFSLLNFPEKVKNVVYGSLKNKINNLKYGQKPLQTEAFSFKEKKKRFSIEDIKLECLKFQGSEESCTQAMIAYDELMTQKSNENIEEEEISRVIYKKCLSFEGNSPLGCSFAYKKALQVLFNIFKIFYF